MKIAVFGHTGMLGRAVVDTLEKKGHNLVKIGRQNADQQFEVGQTNLSELSMDGVNYVINCLGLISHLIDESDVNARLQAANVNSLFPHELARFSWSRGIRMIQIATDCVFSGSTGSYVESSIHDATDIYGITKSIGEVSMPNVMNLRASIIGREQRGFKSLLEWVLTQPNGSEISGYTDRLWNGVTTQVFASILDGVISRDIFRAGIQHLVPADKVTKFKLVGLIAQAHNRQDLRILSTESGSPKDMTLSTENLEVNLELWKAAGYQRTPTISQMIDEMAS
jgi:dTDP-4-dehydrorhamnose reductase